MQEHARSCELVTAEEIAKRFKVTVETVQRWAREGRIPCVRPSRRIVRFRLGDVERAVARGQARGKYGQ